MVKRQAPGCACCGANFGAIFSNNQRLASLARGDTSSISGGGDRARAISGVDRRGFLKGGIASVGAVGLLVDGASADESSAKVFSGGKILTVDAHFSEASAIAIRGNKIVAVVTEADVVEAVGRNATLIDLDGRVMVPGFVDAHTHVVAGSVVDAVMDYVGMARFGATAEVLDYLAAKARETPDGEWIVARNFDPAVQAGPDALGFVELDAVSAVHPVFVLNASGHLAYANTKAFEMAGIPEDIEDPPGAEFVRDENGRLTGEMKNNVAFLQVLESYPAMASVDPVEALISLVGKWGALGLTTVSELSLGALSQSPADAAVMWAAAKSGRLNARIRAYPFYTFGTESWDEAGVSPEDGDAIARIAGYKLVADGSNQGFTGLQREPYLNSENHGIA